MALSTPDFYDLDTPPEPARPARASRIIVWLVVLGLGVLILPLYLIGATIKGENARLEAESQQIQQTLESPPPVSAEEQALTDTLSQIRASVNEIEAARSRFAASHIDWPSVMTMLANYDPAQMGLTGLTQTENRVVLNGEANNEAIVTAYAQMLGQSDRFRRVVVQSMTKQVLPTPTPTASAPAASGETTPGTGFRAEYVEFVILIELKAQLP